MQQSDKPTIINFHEQRKRLLAKRKASKKPTHLNVGKKPQINGARWYHYIQFVMLLVLVAWLMRNCGL